MSTEPTTDQPDPYPYPINSDPSAPLPKWEEQEPHVKKWWIREVWEDAIRKLFGR
jgi:hypothetical protein